MPSVSIVVPVYNVEGQLRRCLDSIRGQSFQDFEIICVNDASSDGCGEILDEYATRDPRIAVVHFPENRGVGAARNEALRRASGETVCICDPDDMLPENSLGVRYAAWKEHQAVVRGQRLELTCTGDVIQRMPYMPEYRSRLFVPSRDLRHIKPLVSHHLWLLPLDLIRKGEVTYNESMRNAQDTWFLAQIFFKIPKMIWLEDVVYVLCDRPGSATNRPFTLENYINVMKPSEKFYEEALSAKKILFGDKYFSSAILYVFDALRTGVSVDMDRGLDALIKYIVGIADRYNTMERILGNAHLLPQYLGLVFLHYLLRFTNGSLKYRLYKATKEMETCIATGKL